MIMNKKMQMQKLLFVFIFALVITILIPALTSAFAFAFESPASANSDEMIICFKSEIPDYAFQKYDTLNKNEELNCILVKAKEGVIQEALADANVKYVEKNKLVHALYVPNDTYYEEQWNLNHTGVDKAWDIEKGSKNVTLAILDTGIDYEHEDLGNYAGGFDFVNNDSDPMDDYGHGTAVSGVAAATIDNGKGIAGIAQVNILALKVLNETGWGTTWNVSKAITYAVNYSADVISMSFGGDASKVMEEACDYAWDKGSILVAAAGNENSSVIYPAAYTSVIAVGATGEEDKRTDYSNFGPELELVAPGDWILTTYPGNEYDYFSGTSFSTPHVSAVAALLKSKYPMLSNDEIRERMRNTARDLGEEGRDDYYGYGLVDAYTALSYLENNPPVAYFYFSPENPVVNETVTFNASYSYDPDGNITLYEWEFGDGANATGEAVNHSYPSAGNYTVNLTVIDDRGAANSTSKTIRVIEKVIFDTGEPENPYPSISGTHNGTITPYRDIYVERMFTYPCAGTGGHSEFVRIWGNGLDVNGTWEGYRGDWHNISFDGAFVLKANVSYNYTIITGSYPQIHHNRTLTVPNGKITCTEFIDANDRTYDNWIPAIKFFL